MYPLKTPGNISMYQGKQMKSSHVSNGKDYMEKLPYIQEINTFFCATSSYSMVNCLSSTNSVSELYIEPKLLLISWSRMRSKH